MSPGKSGFSGRIRALLRLSWVHLVWLILIFMAARFVMYRSYAEESQLAGYGGDILKMWITGLRYDGRISGTATAALFALGLLFSASETGWRHFRKIATVLLWLCTVTVCGFALANYYYYDTYGNFIDIFAFGLFAEGAGAVAGNFWDDYPALRMICAPLLLGVIPAAWGFYTLKIRPERQLPGMRLNLEPTRRHMPVIVLVLCCLLSGAAFFVISRGSLGTFPFGRDDNQISRLEILNKLAPNGIIAFEWAWKDHKKDVSFAEVTAEEGLELKRAAGLAEILAVTPPNPWLAENKPHVVTVMMESFGSNMLSFDRMPENDLLGSLREHLESDFMFHRFVPEGNGTAHSYTGMFFLSPVQNISHSTAQKKPLSHTPFRIYKNAGYRTVFIHPGNMMWRNFAGYLPLQGVDECYDLNDMIRMFPESAKEKTAWGVPDEYAYKLALRLLEDSDRPVFISILTVTNHPPYTVPSTYTPNPVSVTDDLRKRGIDWGIPLENVLKTFQYANDSMGRFISGIKALPLGEKTIIAVTGDHQMRRIPVNVPKENFLHLAVPFYLYVPPAIQENVTLFYDPDRPGSHKDIMPTLYSLSLSEAEYLALGGRNLLAEDDDPSRAFGYNASIWIDEHGAYQAETGAFFAWDMQNPPLLSAELQTIGDKALLEKIRAYPLLLRWQLNARLFGTPLQ